MYIQPEDGLHSRNMSLIVKLLIWLGLDLFLCSFIDNTSKPLGIKVHFFVFDLTLYIIDISIKELTINNLNIPQPDWLCTSERFFL